MGYMGRRNFDKHTDAAQAKLNLLRHCIACCCIDPLGQGVSKSRLGEAAFPGYSFKSPQGAAFAVARLVRELERDGLLAHAVGGRGHYITDAGVRHVQQATLPASLAESGVQ